MNPSYFFLEKKKKGKHKGITSASQKGRKIPAILRRLKHVALRVDTKNNNYTPLHLLLVCFIILDIPTVFSWDAFGYDNPTSLEIEY